MKKMTNPFTGSDNVGGLNVKDGRLINDREDGETGIAQAARYRKQMKKQYKIDCIADGIERAEMRKNMDRLDKYDY
tara:strand:+ start:416 stop:643 length:228 start_codon:yes stop_codon:yes gene_type:complete